MSNHRNEARPSRRRTGRGRAMLLLAAVGVMATGMSVKGTFAFWSDSATVNSGTFSSGTLDITVDGQLAGQAGNGGTTTVAALTLASMVPGESVASSFPVRNNGSVPLTYNLNAIGSGALAVTNDLQYSVTFGGTATNTGSAASGNRAGSCGTTATDANTTLLTSTPTSIATARSLTTGASETVCVVARLNSAAGNSLQGASGSAAFVFDSKQVGAP